MLLLTEENQKKCKSFSHITQRPGWMGDFLRALSWSYFCSSSSVEITLHLNFLAF